MLNNYRETFAFVQIHHGDDYATSWGNARFTFYGAGGYPTSYFDGVIMREGAYPYATYLNDYLNRRGVATDITIELAGEETGVQTFEITATVCMEPGGSGKNLRFYMVQVLDYWPPTPTYHRNGFKQAAATEDFSLRPGDCQQVVRSFTFDTDSWNDQENITIIAWVQEPQSSSPPSDRAEVYQAAIMDWPFPSPYPPGDLDQDGDVDLTDYAIFEGCLGGPEVTTPPTGCDPGDFANADLDDDGDVDVNDFGTFAANFTGS